MSHRHQCTVTSILQMDKLGQRGRLCRVTHTGTKTYSLLLAHAQSARSFCHSYSAPLVLGVTGQINVYFMLIQFNVKRNVSQLQFRWDFFCTINKREKVRTDIGSVLNTSDENILGRFF